MTTDLQRIKATVPDELQDSYRDAPADDAGRQIAWLRRLIRPSAQDDAVRAIFDDPTNPPDAGTVMLAVSAVARLAWPGSFADTAVAAEFGEAKRAAVDLLEKIERRVRALAFSRANGEVIFAAALILCEDAKLFVPTDMLVAACRRIALSTVPVGKGSRAGRG